MLRFFTVAVCAVTVLGGCSGNAGDNQAEPALTNSQGGKPVETSSELDRFMDAPINPADDGIVNFDAEAAGKSEGAGQAPAKPK